MKNHLLNYLFFVSITLSLLVPCALATSTNELESPPLVSEEPPPDAPALVKGTAIDTQFSRECYLPSRNGGDLLFWVKNNGIADIRISVNGEDPKVLSPGQEGQVSVSLTYFTKSYLCQVSPVSEGDWFHIQYRISQERTSS